MLPPYPITAALVAAFISALVLFTLGLVRPFARQPGLRFRTAIGAGWVTLALFLISISLSGVSLDLFDILASISIVVASDLALFVVWSLIAWGFTLNMLLVLTGASSELSLADWADRYTGGAGIVGLARDRLGVLVSSRLVAADSDGQLAMTSRGPFAVRIFLLLRMAFGIGGAAWKTRP